MKLDTHRKCIPCSLKKTEILKIKTCYQKYLVFKQTKPVGKIS